MQQDTIKIYSEETGDLLVTFYDMLIYHFTDDSYSYDYFMYNGERIPIMYGESTKQAFSYMKYSKLQEHDRREYAVKCKTILDYEHLRQLASEDMPVLKGVYCIAKSVSGYYHAYTVKWLKQDSLGYHNVLYVTEHFYARDEYHKIVLSTITLEKRLPHLADALACSTVVQVSKESELYTMFFHPHTTRLEVTA